MASTLSWPTVLTALLLVVGAAVVDADASAAKSRRPFEGTHLELRPSFLRACEDERHNALQEVDVSYEMRGRTTVVILFNATVVRSTDRWTKVRMALEQCDQTVSASTCTAFRTIEFNDPCGMMMNSAMPWAKVVSEVQPRLSCPVEKGRYSLTNGTLSMDLINAMSSTLRLEGHLWRFKARCFDPRGDVHMCVDGAGEFFRVRNRPKSSTG